MTGPTLPPQAYTREILTAAFNWLQTQPESVKKLATTPDALVGLYSRAKRYGQSSLEADAPVSSQNFMTDLKNLAEGLKQFEEPQAPPMVQTPPRMSSQAPSQMHVRTGNGARAQTQNQGPIASESAINGIALNDRSHAMIHEVKHHLNLSSDTETVNMMVAVAYKSLKNLLT